MGQKEYILSRQCVPKILNLFCSQAVIHNRTLSGEQCWLATWGPTEPCNMRRNSKHATVCPANLVVLNVFLALHICDGSSSLNYFSVALIKYHEQKQLGVEKVYFTLQSSGHFHCWEKPEQSVRQERKQRPWREGCYLLLAPWFPQLAFPHKSGPPSPGWHHPQWVGASQINC